ncbi:hypothetical protein R1sor_024168 [Riccia sorocarpa]|uniref:Uncharacterized protein n=1 Tax=Riccia sorocarpa TaxID=122646 RepID=A0ABD3GPR5_9MARC
MSESSVKRGQAAAIANVDVSTSEDLEVGKKREGTRRLSCVARSLELPSRTKKHCGGAENEGMSNQLEMEQEKTMSTGTLNNPGPPDDPLAEEVRLMQGKLLDFLSGNEVNKQQEALLIMAAIRKLQKNHAQTTTQAPNSSGESTKGGQHQPVLLQGHNVQVQPSKPPANSTDHTLTSGEKGHDPRGTTTPTNDGAGLSLRIQHAGNTSESSKSSP